MVQDNFGETRKSHPFVKEYERLLPEWTTYKNR